MKTTLAAVAFYFACAVTISAQANHVDPPLGTTTVSGHVFCADTNAPARMATVVLEPSDFIESIKPGEQLQANFSGEAVETLLDGSFIIHNVTPGTYYVIASKRVIYIPWLRFISVETNLPCQKIVGRRSQARPADPRTSESSR